MNIQLIKEVKAHGIEEGLLIKQLELIKTGTAPIQLERPATINDGIQTFTKNQQQFFIDLYENANQNGLNSVKFVPASGAASRMFQFLFNYLNNKHKIIDNELNKFVNRFSEFPIFTNFQKHYPSFFDEKLSLNPNTLEEAITVLLFEKPYEFAHKPKALIPFHLVNNNEKTALYAQFVEAQKLQKHPKIHLTISAEHNQMVAFEVEQIKQKLNHQVEVETSFQEPYTDTIAITKNGDLLCDNNNRLVFRPGGHGALLQNLGKIKADIIFIKNIDNVLHPLKINNMVLYKKVLAGKLIDLKNKLFDLQLNWIKNGLTKALFNETIAFYKEDLFIDIQVDKNIDLAEILFKPIRVCGMVKNEGEPGGGPFWVVQKNGTVDLQIVEKSQIDAANKQQLKIWEQSTHFNPVDLVCCTVDCTGKSYDLQKFVDTKTAFIVHKDYEGDPIKGLEWPGLWNGSMANWLTVFVEVPVETFNPVKTFNDLLKPLHRA